jgi:hypothetical protein
MASNRNSRAQNDRTLNRRSEQTNGWRGRNERPGIDRARAVFASQTGFATQQNVSVNGQCRVEDCARWSGMSALVCIRGFPVRRWSGRTMARSGRRMMPAFPSSPLKFRTVSFPQSGFKASLSSRAFLHDNAVKPAPGIRASPPSLHRPFARVRHGLMTWLRVQVQPRLRAPLCARPSPRYPRGSLAPVRVMLSRSIIA